MRFSKQLALIPLLIALGACGKMVDFGAEPDASADASTAADSGSGNGSTDAGGTAGMGGSVDSGGIVALDGGGDDSGADDEDSGAGGDAIAPRVLSFNPSKNATNVRVDVLVTVGFDEAIDRSSLNAATFTVTRGTTPIAGIITLVGNEVTFTPTQPLDDETTYTVNVSRDVTDLAGNHLSKVSKWSFTTGDYTRPTVGTTSPANGAIEVPANAGLSAMFSENVDGTMFTGAFTVMRGLTVVTGTVSVVGNVATFTPGSALPDGDYTATISTAAKDFNGNALLSPFSWTFSVGDDSRPFVVAVSPAPHAVDIAVNTSITAMFSEALNPNTVTLTSFTVKRGANLVTGMLTSVGKNVTFVPNADLLGDTVYTVTISSTVTDLDGNSLASASTWDFKTIHVSGPQIVFVSPQNGNTNVKLNQSIKVAFDDELDENTVVDPLNFVVTTGPANLPVPVTGVITYDDVESIATFVPTGGLLLPNTTYTVTLTTDVEDLLANPLAQDESWMFMTGADVLPLVQLPVPLVGISNFAILAATAITNIPTSKITGDVGLDPSGGASVSGFKMPLTCPEVVGKIYVVDATGPACAVVDTVVLADAKLAAAAAYIDATAAVRGTPQAISGDLNGLTLYPGLYESGSTIEISPGGILYLDAQGDSSAVFIIRSATSITTQSTSAVVLTKGAKAANVYWTAGSAITLGVRSTMKGTMIAGTALSLLTGANLEGRAISQGPAATAVTLDSATITLPSP